MRPFTRFLDRNSGAGFSSFYSSLRGLCDSWHGAECWLHRAEKLVERVSWPFPEMDLFFGSMMVLPLSLLLVLFHAELLRTVDNLQKRFRLRSLYFWPSHGMLYELGWLSLACWVPLLLLLELAGEGPEDDDSFGGVHILLGIFRMTFLCWVVTLVTKFMRVREELVPVFPPRCRRVQERRTPRIRRGPKIRWVYVGLLATILWAEAAELPSPSFELDYQDLPKGVHVLTVTRMLSLGRVETFSQLMRDHRQTTFGLARCCSNFVPSLFDKRTDGSCIQDAVVKGISMVLLQMATRPFVELCIFVPYILGHPFCLIVGLTNMILLPSCKPLPDANFEILQCPM